MFLEIIRFFAVFCSHSPPLFFFFLFRRRLHPLFFLRFFLFAFFWLLLLLLFPIIQWFDAFCIVAVFLFQFVVQEMSNGVTHHLYLITLDKGEERGEGEGESCEWSSTRRYLFLSVFFLQLILWLPSSFLSPHVRYYGRKFFFRSFLFSSLLFRLCERPYFHKFISNIYISFFFECSKCPNLAVLLWCATHMYAWGCIAILCMSWQRYVNI